MKEELPANHAKERQKNRLVEDFIFKEED